MNNFVQYNEHQMAEIYDNVVELYIVFLYASVLWSYVLLLGFSEIVTKTTQRIAKTIRSLIWR